MVSEQGGLQKQSEPAEISLSKVILTRFLHYRKRDFDRHPVFDQVLCEEAVSAVCDHVSSLLFS